MNADPDCRSREVLWSNNSAVRVQADVLAFRAGFEILFSGQADTRGIREKLSALQPGEWCALANPSGTTIRGRRHGPLDLSLATPPGHGFHMARGVQSWPGCQANM